MDPNATNANAGGGGGGFDEEESQENLVAKFQTLSAEGDLLAQKRAYTEAISVFDQALAIRPADTHCLVARSKCYISVGSPAMALADAEACLAIDPQSVKGLFQKAQALYARGDFEVALVFYHRGYRLRPELDSFRIGIQKSREAIENAIGGAGNPIKIGVPAGRRAAVMAGGAGDGGATGVQGMATAAESAYQNGGGNAKSKDAGASSGADPYVSKLTPTMECKLLGELYEDKCYLYNLLNDKDLIEHPDAQLQSLVREGLQYLSSRVEFWMQQHPLYARPKHRKIRYRVQPKRAATTGHGLPEGVLPPLSPQKPSTTATSGDRKKSTAFGTELDTRAPKLPADIDEASRKRVQSREASVNVPGVVTAQERRRSRLPAE